MASMLLDETTSTGEEVVSVSKSFNVLVGRTGTKDFLQKCFCVSGKTCLCRTWFRLQVLGCFNLGSKRVKRSLIEGDVAKKRSLLRVRIVQNVCFGILRKTNKNFGGFFGKFVLLRYNVFESSTTKYFQIEKIWRFTEKHFEERFTFW